MNPVHYPSWTKDPVREADKTQVWTLSTIQVGSRIQSEKLTKPKCGPCPLSELDRRIQSEKLTKPKCGPCPLSELDRRIQLEKLTNPSVDPIHYPSWIKDPVREADKTQVWALSTIRVGSRDPVREADKPKLDRKILSEKLTNPSWIERSCQRS